MADDIQERIRELRGRLLSFRADRFPVEHAVAQFHLGTTLIEAGNPGGALPLLRASAKLFEQQGMPVEQAKAKNMLGAALRAAGRLDEAADTFDHAGQLFETNRQPLERGAALFNLGLVRRDLGDLDAAAKCFQQAGELFDEGGRSSQASAAARELGTTEFAAGRLDQARDALERAIELAQRGGDLVGLGAAANPLGIVELALGRTEAAVAAFLSAVGANPRTLRAEGYSMAKANLALAYEQSDDAPRARLAARQALATPAAPPPVREQAGGVLSRLGDGTGDLLIVLKEEPQEKWPVLIREELLRWVEVDPGERLAESRAWVEGVLARREVSVELAQAWLEVLLELPPDAMETLIASTIETLRGRDPESVALFRDHVSRAMARFHIPQWDRLRETFNRLAEELGEEPAWH
ncbi:MAG: tetratricopeptide repeat protein [Actinomycetota bacterium]|nr:tetratricopeptide repeat protein [Actinomycetota bacterium]